MKISHRLAASIAALGLMTGALGAPALANAATLSTADVAKDTKSAIIKDVYPKYKENDPMWRAMLQRSATEGARGYADKPLIKEITVHSPAMDRDIPVVIKKSKTENAPTYYLLNGAGGGEQTATDWISQTNVLDYFYDKDVNLVIPMAGKFSYYIDWANQEPIPGLGGAGDTAGKKQLWETFLTKELPGPLETMLKANGKRAISGMSMSATSSLLLAQHNQGFYDAVGSFSGCASTSKPLPYQFAKLTMNNGSGAKATVQDVFGPQGSTHNVYNDALINAEKLRDARLYISNGSGLARETDTAGYRRAHGAPDMIATAGSAETVVVGGVIEAATNACTHDLKAKLDASGIPADYMFHNAGTHSWPSWAEDVTISWERTIGPALGVEKPQQ
ncbi:alpha/beta hydrolase [Corynebacterium caspium]|uniref:alpha/beta hydrolase n=1 Tax=Corynebacterium caspium TaxID=234828 RepID=UPI00037B0CB3|nr:alpha/beta hydrolase family protein [Corynebacterium caspium]WKD59938.1 Diacylglycerol acyltransferase/mycolyltransferase Ag85A precursor [Corynebacterium caspium DSM 44850]